TAEYCTTPACVTAAASIINCMDPSVNPCEDFYQFACGGWIKSNPLQENKNQWERYDELTQTINHILKHVLEDESFPLKSEAERKARTFYKSCMNKTLIEELGALPMLDLLNKTGGWFISGDFSINDWNFQRILEVQHNQYGAQSFFSWTVGSDLKNSSRNIIELDEPQLTLDGRNYYLNNTKDDKVKSWKKI
ncbi:endothelin-converting enzyme homolog, partial [Nephila pilipes]